MVGASPQLGVVYPASFPEDALTAFVNEVEHPLLSVRVDRTVSELAAGSELSLPTLSFVVLTGAYLTGLLREAGKDHYLALKSGVGRLWVRLSTMSITAVATSPNKLGGGGYSRAFCLMAAAGNGQSIKLLVPTGTTLDEMDAATDAFRAFLEDFYAGRSAPPTFSGGVALFTYDPTTRVLRSVTRNEA